VGSAPFDDRSGREISLPESGRTDSSIRPTIEEMLVCSLQGEVLHEWRCPNTTGRIGFLEFVSQKARQLAQSLPLGTFDRLEMNGTNGRAIAHLQPDRAMFLRTSRQPAPVKDATNSAQQP